MKTKIFLGLILFAVNFVKAQECKYSSLSDKFEFEIRFTRLPPDSTGGRIDIGILDKKTKHKQQIVLHLESIFSRDFKDCKFVKSFSKGFNVTIPVADNCSGDFIVIDLNFDGLEDFAVLSDAGGNGGPTYSFYIQDKKGKFEKDEYLTKTMEFFPLEINKAKKRLTIYVHASAYQLRKTVFGYNSKSKKWKVVSNFLVDYDDSPNEIEVN